MIANQSSVLYPPGFPAEVFGGWLRGLLESSHLVFCRFVDTCPLQKELLVEGSSARRVLGSGFNRVVAVDARKGLTWRGEFQLARFHRHVFAQLVKAFGSGRPGTYQEKDIVQLLRDAPSSLICLLNVHVVPRGDLGSLRSLVQEKHQAVVLYECGASSKVGGADTPCVEELERRLSSRAAAAKPQGEMSSAPKIEGPKANAVLKRGRTQTGQAPLRKVPPLDAGVVERGPELSEKRSNLDADDERTNPDSVSRLIGAGFAALGAGDAEGARQYWLAAKQLAPGRRSLDALLKRLETEAGSPDSRANDMDGDPAEKTRA